AGARLDPDAGDRFLAAAGGIGAALGVALVVGLGGIGGIRRLGLDQRGLEFGELVLFGHRLGCLVLGVLGIHLGDVQLLGLLGLMGMLRARIDAQVRHLAAAQGAPRHHALHGLFQHPLGELAGHDGAGGAFLDAADIAGVVVIDLLLQLLAGQHHLGGVDDDDVVAAVQMGGVGGLVLAAQAHGDDRSKTAHDQPFGVDQDPLLLDLGGFRRVGFHV